MIGDLQRERIRVFISSTFSDLRYARETVALAVKEMNAEPRAFPEQSLAGEAVNAFLGELEQAHVLILLVTEPSPWVEQEIDVAEAAGIPVLELAELRHLKGSTTKLTEYARSRLRDASHYQARWASLTELRTAVREGLAALIARRFSGDASLRPVALDTYQTIATYVGRARKRLAVVQDTSTLLLGPRLGRYHQEQSAYEQLHAQIDRLLDARDGDGVAHSTGKNATHLRLIHLFSLHSTMNELRERPSSFPSAQEALEWLAERRERIGRSATVSLVACTAKLTPFVIQDAMFAFPSWVDGNQFWHEQREAGRVVMHLWAPVENAVLGGRPATGLIEAARAILQSSAESDEVVLLNQEGRPSGTLGKHEAHDPPGRFHLAVSVVVVDELGNVLLQQRDDAKYHFGGRWSNACCSHPPSEASMTGFAQRRLAYEMGIDLRLEHKGFVDYVAEDTASLRVENERTHVFLGVIASATVPRPREGEAQNYEWVSPDELAVKLGKSPGHYTPWLKEVLEKAGVLT